MKTAIEKPKPKEKKRKPFACASFGPLNDLERHLPLDWWKRIFNSVYLKTDGDVIDNEVNTKKEIDLVLEKVAIEPFDHVLDLCCGQGRHCIELAKRGFRRVTGVDKSRYLIRLAKKTAGALNLPINFYERDARNIGGLFNDAFDVVLLMGNSFGYFEKEEDDLHGSPVSPPKEKKMKKKRRR